MSDFFIQKTKDTHDFSAEDLPDKILRTAIESYQSILPEEGLPLIENIQSTEVQNIAGYSSLLFYEEETDRYIYQYLGEQLKKLYGKDIAGKTPEEEYSKKIAKTVRHVYESVRQEQRPMFSSTMWRMFTRSIGYYKVTLPFIDINNQPNLFLSFITPSDLNIKTESDWKNAEDIKSFRDLIEASKNNTVMPSHRL